MSMNKNTIEFNDFTLDIKKINKDQYTILRQVFIAIDKKQMIDNTYYFLSDIFEQKTFDTLIKILKTNVNFSIIDNKNDEWYGSNIINDIKLIKNKIYFRPASILREIILQSKYSPKHSHLKHILFNGIRYKSSLLFLDYMFSLEKNFFTLELLEFKKIVELKETQYKNFNALKASVIDRIIDDINTKTTYHIECKSNTLPNKKKVISVTFNYYNQDIKDG